MLHDEAHGVGGLHRLDGIVITKQTFVDDTCFLRTRYKEFTRYLGFPLLYMMAQEKRENKMIAQVRSYLISRAHQKFLLGIN